MFFVFPSLRRPLIISRLALLFGEYSCVFKKINKFVVAMISCVGGEDAVSVRSFDSTNVIVLDREPLNQRTSPRVSLMRSQAVDVMELESTMTPTTPPCQPQRKLTRGHDVL